MKTRAVMAGLLVTFVIAASALAHDYWLMPEKLSAKVGQEVIVRLYRGEDLSITAKGPRHEDQGPN